MPCLSRLLATVALTLATMPAMAAKLERVEVAGLDETMTENVRTNLSLEDSMGKVLGGRHMGYLGRVAEHEAREALEPFGCYSPRIVIQRSDRDAPESDARANAAPRSDNAERAALQQQLGLYRWNIGKTADALGVSRNTLYRKPRKHGLAGCS